MWNQKSNIPAEGRHRTSGWSIGNKGYIGLGHYNSGFLGNVAKADIWEYDPSVDSWTQKADYGGGPTYGACSFTIGNKAYVGAHVYNSSEFYEFDPIQNTWTLIPPVPVGTSDVTAFTANGKGYFVGTNELYEYDADLMTWTAKTPCPAYVYSWSKSFVVDNKGYVLVGGGIMYEYKPLTDQWVLRSPYPGDAQGGWSTFNFGGKGYVATGYIQFLNPTSRQTWQYDPADDTWLQLQDLPGGSRRFSSSFSIGDRGYLGTGTNGTNFNDFWEFDATLSTDDLFSSLSITAYPNPSNENIKILIGNSNPMDLNLDVYDLSGRLVYQESSSTSEFNLNRNDFNNGTFIYHISTESGESTKGKITFI